MRKALKGLRIESELTQQEIANRLQISRSAYTNIELGKKNPSFELSIQIKKLFRYENDDIFLNS
ncbi:helix-turn-helix transcriptional regulator [Clostridium sp. 'White wine YQ']|uniref:helix-turn-helix transcriptional regulator n=1 Tax=Clostridium sp. 'White wine YQ' TaxID=3027474 RepID=UPI00236724AB|nr:helix-turn-helix domain-containing protein [Clostridium sp. 'White wine YQ']MDD7793663.1 helix-turn-helix domain-containing protein [Clostridium sp. 'White wine YQ']